jgi:hypothetical protein
MPHGSPRTARRRKRMLREAHALAIGDNAMLGPKVACSLLLLPFAAAAQDWFVYSKLNDGSRHSLDRSSLEQVPTWRVWTMVEPAVPFPMEGRPIHTWMALVEVNCTERTHRGLREVGYAQDGELVYQSRSGAPLHAVVAESVGAARLEAICQLP